MILNKNWNFYYVFKFDHIKLMTTVHTMQSGSRSKSHIIRNGVVSHATRPHERNTQNRPKFLAFAFDWIITMMKNVVLHMH